MAPDGRYSIEERDFFRRDYLIGNSRNAGSSDVEFHGGLLGSSYLSSDPTICSE